MATGLPAPTLALHTFAKADNMFAIADNACGFMAFLPSCLVD